MYLDNISYQGSFSKLCERGGLAVDLLEGGRGVFPWSAPSPRDLKLMMLDGQRAMASQPGYQLSACIVLLDVVTPWHPAGSASSVSIHAHRY